MVVIYVLYVLKHKLWLRRNLISKYFLLRIEVTDTI